MTLGPAETTAASVVDKNILTARSFAYKESREKVTPRDGAQSKELAPFRGEQSDHSLADDTNGTSVVAHQEEDDDCRNNPSPVSVTFKSHETGNKTNGTSHEEEEEEDDDDEEVSVKSLCVTSQG